MSVKLGASSYATSRSGNLAGDSQAVEAWQQWVRTECPKRATDAQIAASMRRPETKRKLRQGTPGKRAEWNQVLDGMRAAMMAGGDWLYELDASGLWARQAPQVGELPPPVCVARMPADAHAWAMENVPGYAPSNPEDKPAPARAKPVAKPRTVAPAVVHAPVPPETPSVAPAAAGGLPDWGTEWLDRLLCDAKREFCRAYLEHRLTGAPAPASDAGWVDKATKRAERLIGAHQ